MIAHFEHFAATAADGFHDDADKILGNVDDQAFHRFELFSVFVANDNFGFAHHEFETFTAHGFDKDGKLQFTAAENTKGFGSFRVFNANGNIGEEFLGETIAQVAGGEVSAFAPTKRAGIDGKDHGEGGLVDGQRFERSRILDGGDAFTDLNAFDAGDGNDVASRDAVGLIALEAAKRVELRDFGGQELAIEFANANFFAAIQCAIEDAAD